MISVRSRTRALTSSSRLRCWRGLRSSLQITTSNSPSSFMSRSEATLPMPRKCAGSTSDRRCTSVPTTSVPAVRARSASSAIWSRTLSGVAPGSRIPTRYARSRGLLVVITQGPPRNRGEASDFVGISELELPHPRHRFLEPRVGGCDRKPEIAFAVRAEPDTGCDVHADLIEHVRRKTNRVIPVGHRRPHIKGRARRLDLPAEAVQGVRHDAMAARIDSAGCPRLLLPTVHRLNACPLDSLEYARVDVRLQLADQVHEVRAAADPADSPAGHVVRLRQGVKFEAYFFRAWNLEIRRVVAQHDVMAATEVDRSRQEVTVRSRRGGVVRIVEPHEPSALRDFKGNRVEVGQPVVGRGERHRVRIGAGHDRAGDVHGVPGIWRQYHVAWVDESERDVADAVLGAKRGQDLGIRVELDT